MDLPARLRDAKPVRLVRSTTLTREPARAATLRIGSDLAVGRLGFGAMRLAGLLAVAEADGVAFSPWFPTTVADQSGTASHMADVLDPHRAKYQARMPQLALAWLLHHSPVMLLIPGTSSPEHFREKPCSGVDRPR